MDRLLVLGRSVAGLVGAAAIAAALPATAAGDIAAGHAVFAGRCAQCHSAAKGGAVILGPSLFGVVGRPAATAKGFAYSSAMKTAGITWTVDKLGAYLPAPAKMVPGTKMTFVGLKNPTQVEDVIAYLSTLR
jgi:cytochrome c